MEKIKVDLHLLLFCCCFGIFIAIIIGTLSIADKNCSDAIAIPTIMSSILISTLNLTILFKINDYTLSQT